jgi:hypothetical protein
MNAILLVPGPADLHGLLSVGPCGAIPPAALKNPDTGHWEAFDHENWTFEPGCLEGVALALVWEGQPIAAACDRVIRILMERRDLITFTFHVRYAYEEAEALAEACVARLGCSLVHPTEDSA